MCRYGSGGGKASPWGVPIENARGVAYVACNVSSRSCRGLKDEWAFAHGCLFCPTASHPRHQSNRLLYQILWGGSMVWSHNCLIYRTIVLSTGFFFIASSAKPLAVAAINVLIICSPKIWKWISMILHHLVFIHNSEFFEITDNLDVLARVVARQGQTLALRGKFCQ